MTGNDADSRSEVRHVKWFFFGTLTDTWLRCLLCCIAACVLCRYLHNGT